MKNKFIQSIIKYPKRYLACVITFSLGFSLFLLNFQSIFTTRMWFDANHPISKGLDKYESQFGSSNFLAFGVFNSSGVFKKESRELLLSLEEDLSMVKHVLRVESLANMSSIVSEGDDINITPFESYFENESLLFQNLKEQYPELNHIVSKELDYTQIMVYLIPNKDNGSNYTSLYNDFENLANKYRKEGLEINLIGSMATSKAFTEVSKRDNMIMIPISTFLIVLFLLLIFRNFYALFLPIALAFSSITLSFSFMSLLGLKYNNMLAAVPGILLAICIADSIHIISSFFLEKKTKSSSEALYSSLEMNFLPTFLTSISTMISFLSISRTSIIPVRDLGILVAFGTFIAWFFTYVFLGATLVLVHEKMQPKTSFLDKFLSSFSFTSKSYIDWVDKFKGVIIFLFAFLLGTSIYYSLQLKVDSDPIKYFDKSHPFRLSAEHVSDKLGFERAFEIIVDSGENDGVKKVDFLQRHEKLLNWTLKKPEVKDVKSINNIVKKMNDVLDQKKSIPTKQKTLAELLFLYELSAEPDSGLNKFMDNLNRYSRIQIFWDVTNVSESRRLMDEIVEKAKSLNLKAYPGGEFPIFANLVSNIVSTFLNSMLTALGLVFLLMLFVFRNLKISLISMLPNLIPLSFAGFLVYASGLFLDIGTSMIATITLGIAIDDTIHFVSRYQEAIKKSLPVKEALVYTIDHCAAALIQTTIVLCCGFGVFYFASFMPNRNFGVFTSACISLALITDLVLLPAVLLALPSGKEKL